MCCMNLIFCYKNVPKIQITVIYRIYVCIKSRFGEGKKIHIMYGLTLNKYTFNVLHELDLLLLKCTVDTNYSHLPYLRMYKLKKSSPLYIRRNILIKQLQTKRNFCF